MEHGLRQFLLKNHALSTKYFQAALHELSNNHQQCQTILKMIAVIGIDMANNDPTKTHLQHLQMIDFTNFRFTCFLGVLNDLILPYLLDIKHNESDSLLVKLNKTVTSLDKECDKEATDEERLDCTPRLRYTIAHGLTALKTEKLQDLTKWPQYVTDLPSREDWVCSIIRDKTTKCENFLPLFSKVRHVETPENHKSLWALSYFMDKDTYRNLLQRAEDIPRFYQRMSI